MYRLQSFMIVSNFIFSVYSHELNTSLIESSEKEYHHLKKVLLPSLFPRPSLFHVVKFPNDECYDSSNQSGTCYTPIECKAYGGISSGSCAKGYGVCCIISRSCHNATSQKVIYFKNPSYPQPDTTQNYCDLTVEIRDQDVCQLRLDLLDFQLDQPTSGECLGDKFTVSASGLAPTAIPTLCGYNRNQHLYINLPKDKSDRSASILFVTNSFGNYRWHVKITQILCLQNGRTDISAGISTSSSGFYQFPRAKRSMFSPFTPRAELKVSVTAPTGCLQYFTEPSGIVESFNFGEYLNNMDYAICIERQPNTCKITYKASDYDWSLDKNNQPKSAAGYGDVECNTDYLAIPGGSSSGEGFTFDRFCGGKLSASTLANMDTPIVSRANGPIVLRFHSDHTHDQTNKEGFRLRYEQSSTNCQFQYSYLPSYSASMQGFEPSPVAASLIKYLQYSQDGVSNQTPRRKNAKRMVFIK